MFADPGKIKGVGGSPLPETINPNNFPAKLWRLVNNPANISIRWNEQGQVIVIDRRLFEAQILSPSNSASDNADAFKTTNFSSFVRQLNLYGFKKAVMNGKHDCSQWDCVRYLYFYNPNFLRNHPELVASLRRLTVQNKALMQAGLGVKNRVPSRFCRYSRGYDDKNTDVTRGNYSPMSSPHPYHRQKAQAMAAHNGTPVPPRFLPRGHGAALSPNAFVTDKGIPVSFSQHYSTGAASNSNPMHIQQGLLACSSRGNPTYAFNVQYPPGYYSPLWQCYHQNLVASQMAGRGLSARSFSSPTYYQGSYPVSMLHHVDHNQYSKTEEHQEVKKSDIHLDTIFQIADEVMQTSTNSRLVRVATPQKPGPVFVPFSANTTSWDNPAVKSNHLSPGPSVISVTGRADLFSFQPKEESGISLAEQLPEDAICEVSRDMVDFLKEFCFSFLKTRYFAGKQLDGVRLAVCK
ncbi:heat shock factor protein 5 [Pseudoliparis swirei]|uniref:heat shock factor protein 5 n=1 Tax=Pseudoliparis swirei TaxID=2059687 RepID=UPI0024BE4F76|nr:heat shock factor protein 5 [Pseudoliparis swirei]